MQDNNHSLQPDDVVAVPYNGYTDLFALFPKGLLLTAFQVFLLVLNVVAFYLPYKLRLSQYSRGFLIQHERQGAALQFQPMRLSMAYSVAYG